MRVAELIGRAIDLCYVRPFSSLFSRTMFRYAVCGGANMVLDVVWYFVIYHYIVAERYFDLGFVVMSPHVASLVVVFPITFFTGFWLNRNVAFPGSPLRSINQLIRYGLSVAGSFVISYVLMKIFVEGCGFYPTPSNILTSMICVVYSYLASRFFTFRGARKE